MAACGTVTRSLQLRLCQQVWWNAAHSAPESPHAQAVAGPSPFLWRFQGNANVVPLDGKPPDKSNAEWARALPEPLLNHPLPRPIAPQVASYGRCVSANLNSLGQGACERQFSALQACAAKSLVRAYAESAAPVLPQGKKEMHPLHFKSCHFDPCCQRLPQRASRR